MLYLLQNCDQSTGNRLKKVIGFIISDSQSAFFPNCSISNNIILGYESLHFLQNQKSKGNGISWKINAQNWVCWWLGISYYKVYLYNQTFDAYKWWTQMLHLSIHRYSSGWSSLLYLFILCAKRLYKILQNATTTGRVSRIWIA